MSARPGQKRAGGWTAEQDAIITDNPNWSAEQIAAAASQIGLPRTIGAASSRRKKLGLPTPSGGTRGLDAHYSAQRVARDKETPWPSVPASYEAQDQRHLTTLRHAGRLFA